MSRIGAYLAASVERLRRMQLPTGEMPAVEIADAAEPYYAPSPLLSALAYDAMAFVDPASPLFVGRVRELVRPSFFRAVASLRWSLRLYIASEEEADGTWQRHGRLGARGADAATTACGAAALLPHARWPVARPDGGHVEALRRLAAERAWDGAEAAHALRYLALAGAEWEPLARRVWDDLARVETLAHAHAVARAWRQAQLPEADAVARKLVQKILRSTEEGYLARALACSALLDLEYEGEELDAMLRGATADRLPPWHWPADPYGASGMASPAVALAITVANVARLTAIPRGERP